MAPPFQTSPSTSAVRYIDPHLAYTVTDTRTESYAGLLPISDAKNASELYFWFFPSANVNASDEILIWLNGGPVRYSKCLKRVGPLTTE